MEILEHFPQRLRRSSGRCGQKEKFQGAAYKDFLFGEPGQSGFSFSGSRANKERAGTSFMRKFSRFSAVSDFLSGSGGPRAFSLAAPEVLGHFP